MPIYNFGVGTLIGRRNGVDSTGTAITNPTPARFGVVQDVQVDFDRSLKTLMGQYQFPVDIAAAEFKISGKAKFADIQARVYNDLYFGQTLTTGGELDAIDEVHAAAATVTIAPPSSGTFVHDLGVRYQSSGIILTRTGSAPSVGSYEVTEPGGVYTFNASETGNLLISYSYTVSTVVQSLTLSNQLMGISPSFEIHLQSFYPNSVSNLNNSFNLRLNACKADKFSMPFKNIDYEIPDFSFMAFADASGNVGQLTFTQ